MARLATGRYYRVTPRFWQDSDVRNEWTEDMRMLAMYLMTSPHRNMIGLYYCPMSYIESDLQWKPKRLQVAFESLSSDTVDFVRYDPATQVVFLVKGLKHDSPNTPQQVVGAINVLRNLPQTHLRKDLLAAADVECELLAIAMRKELDWQSIEVRLPDTVPRIPDTEERESTSSTPAAVDPLSPEAVADEWNAVCGNTLPKVQKLTDKRRTHLRSRLREPGRDLPWWRSYFQRILASGFLVGENGRGWKADFDWATGSEDNVLKVLEGKYDSRASPADPPAAKPKTVLDPYESKPQIKLGGAKRG